MGFLPTLAGADKPARRKCCATVTSILVDNLKSTLVSIHCYCTSTSAKRTITFLVRLYFVIWGKYWWVYCFIGCGVAKTLPDTISLDRANLAQHKNNNKVLDRPSISASGNSFKPIYNSLGNHKINTVTEAVGPRGLADSHRPAPSRVHIGART